MLFLYSILSYSISNDIISFNLFLSIHAHPCGIFGLRGKKSEKKENEEKLKLFV